MTPLYDVVVIGAGHAGIEAATASARLGARTVLITMNLSNLGELSCNPSIGGIGKGTVVKEIDAMGGIMALAVDKASIHRKILNASKGPAVWGPRHQIDRKLYKKAILELLNDYQNLSIITGEVVDIIVKNDAVCGIKLLTGKEISCKSVVCTTGTFLRGKTLLGEEREEAGRINEKASNFLTDALRRCNLNISRLKTGTPCRLNKNTIDFASLEKQETDDDCPPMSHLNDAISTPQMTCFITHTNQKSHNIISSNQHRIPALNGEITVNGPRYCPSIETKVQRFSDKERHQVFLEPEGLDSELIYPNGISTSMPRDMQLAFISTIKGLENAKIEQFGYAIEYDFVDPRNVKNTLETKTTKGLFLAGQILGTTGYEEAAGLGLIAGANAALIINNQKFTLDRHQAYIGVMIDDLITLGVAGEPYRLFTSRSEYRLSCRSDNADMRLTAIAKDIGLIDDHRWSIFSTKLTSYNKMFDALNNLFATPSELQKHNIKINQDGIRRSGFEILQYQDISIDDLRKICSMLPIVEKNIEQLITTDARYYNYIARQKEEIEEMKKQQEITIPNHFDFSIIQSLSSEAVEKLNKVKPQNVGQISKIPGLTPAAVLAVIIHLKRLG